MRLISLTANQKSFHTVKFNETGLTLIVGKQQETDEDSSKRTYNGVGKSLLVALVHYCLGSNKIRAFEDKLGDWLFRLKFTHDNKEYTAIRAVNKSNVIILNGEELSLKNFNNELKEMLFPQIKKYKGLSFRELFKIFVRKNRLAYTSFDSADYSSETPYKKQLRLTYLLGLDTSYAIEKYNLRQKIADLQAKQQQFEKDELFRNFFVGDSNPDIEKNELSTNIRRLESRLKDYLVAEDYHIKQREANDVTYSLQQLRNKQELISKGISQINESLKMQPDITPEKIYEIYDEINAALPDMVKHKIEKVSGFYAQLLQIRSKKLTQERKRLNKILEALLGKIDTLNNQRDTLLRYLGEHGALDEYTASSIQLGEMKAKVEKIEDYQQLLRGYSDKKANAEMKFKKNNAKTNQYLEDMQPIIKSNMDAFTTFSGRFYEEKPGGLAVNNNEGDNQVRFAIDAQIQDDASDGINEVKIFCFDMTILTQRHNHSMNFLFHDSRLFSDMDPRQRAIALGLALEICTQGKYQYIATINQDQLESSRQQWSPEMSQSIDNSITLDLTDEGPQSKLLGIQVDMDYDK